LASYPYTSATGKFKEFMGGIIKRGEPDKITQAYLEKIGFKTREHRKFIPILKHIGFLDGGGKPTSDYRGYMNTDTQKAVLAKCEKASYPDLFRLHPDAYRKDNETLSNFFRTETGLGAQAVTYMVRTFKAIISLADFDTEIEDVASPVQLVDESSRIQLLQKAIPTEGGLTVNLNVQLSLPITDNVQIYEQIFKLLGKHLLGRDESNE
jgi:hypothetical protein